MFTCFAYSVFVSVSGSVQSYGKRHTHTKETRVTHPSPGFHTIHFMPDLWLLERHLQLKKTTCFQVFIVVMKHNTLTFIEHAPQCPGAKASPAILCEAGERPW